MLRLVMQRSFGVLLVCGIAACGGPKQAEDPRDLLGGDLEHRGVDGTQGTNPNDFDTGQGGDSPAAAGPALASEAQCKGAAERMVELGIDNVLREEMPSASAAERQQKKKELMAGSAEDVQAATENCLRAETTDREANCIARVQREEDIDRCAAEPDLVGPPPPPPKQQQQAPKSKTLSR